MGKTRSPKQIVSDQGDAKFYWTQIPNIVYDIGLTPYELTLYCHLKRIAGEHGKCFMSTRTMSQRCNISRAVIHKAKAKLAEPKEALNGIALIKIIEKQNPQGGRDYHEIRLTDIWKINTDRYYKQGPDIDLETQEQGLQSEEARSMKSVKQGRVVDHKKNVLKKNNEEEQDALLLELKSDPAYEHVDVSLEFQKARRWCAMNHRQLTPKFFVNWLNRIDRPFRPLDDPAMNGTVHDEAWHAKQAALARRMGREYRPVTS